MRIAPTTTELLTQRAEYVAGQGVPLFELRPPVFAGLDWATKRAFDIVVSALIVVVGAPVWLADRARGEARLARARSSTATGASASASASSGCSSSARCTSTRASARPGSRSSNEASGPLFKIKDDPRVTRVGRFLRRYSIDELPQVLNVLRGEMSLVGPRPLPLRDYVQLEDWHRKRYLVLPGMTGLWQVSGRIELTFDDLVRLDFYYLENWSIWLDISILAKTLPAVLARRGAY